MRLYRIVVNTGGTPIFRTGKWIDLDHITAVDDPVIINEMGYGGMWSSMKITTMMRDQPIEIRGNIQAVYPDNDPSKSYIRPERCPEVYAEQLAPLQEVHKKLLDVWMGEDY